MRFVENLLPQLMQDKKETYLKILNTISDPIYICDHTGKTLWVNQSSENICERSRGQLIGKNVADLEREGVFSPSVTRLALQSRKTISTVQEMSNGRKYLVTGHIIFDDHGDLELVLAHSHDITEVVRTTAKLEETESLLRKYSSEIRKQKVYQINELKQNFIGTSKKYQALLNLIDKISLVNTTVLITGETGCGKNVIAQRIHRLSERCDKSFVHINCGAVPDSLIESELFGYKKGAFTGASQYGKTGLVKAAEGGTLFLDEIGELPIHLQAKLLQLLQDKSYRPVGDSQTYTANIQIITATNQNLEQMIKEGKFREDLYYRLNVVCVNVPPLRERREDIRPLLSFYLDKFNQQYEKELTFSKEASTYLENYEWPGNVRELENLVEGLSITAKQSEVMIDDLPFTEKTKKQVIDNITINTKGKSLTKLLSHVEKNLIEQSYNKHQSTRKAAKELGISQSSLMRRIQKYGIKI